MSIIVNLNLNRVTDWEFAKGLECVKIVSYSIGDMPHPFIKNYYQIAPIFIRYDSNVKEWGFVLVENDLRKAVIEAYINENLDLNCWYSCKYDVNLNAINSRALNDIMKVSKLTGNYQENDKN